MRVASVAARTVRWAIAGEGSARGRAERAAVILEVRSDRGAIGLGEAAPLPGMSVDTLDDARRAIAALAARVPFEVSDRDAAFAIADSVVRAAVTPELSSPQLARASVPSPVHAPAARFAIETALLDALAREHGISLAALLCSPVDAAGTTAGAHAGADGSPRLSTAPHDHVDGARVRAASERAVPARAAHSPLRRRRIPLSAVVDDQEAARRAFAAGIRCLKIKLRAADDPGRVFAIANAAGGATLRIDANRSWPYAEVADRLAALASLPIEHVEEPCLDAHRLLATALPHRLALDESLGALAPDELEAALCSPHLAALVLKPTLLGGLLAVLRLAERARRTGVAAIVSHTLEGPIGTAACAELALALGGERAVGLARHPALDGWLVEVPQLAADHVCPAAVPGLGLAEIDLATAVRSCRAALPSGSDR